jgi:propionyl-CoA carboxylase beta chain
MGLKENLEELKSRNDEALQGGGPERTKRHHEAGKFTARERVELLLDPGSFVELDRLKTHRCTDFDMDKKKTPGDGVVTGYGTVDGRQILSSHKILRSLAGVSQAHFRKSLQGYGLSHEDRMSVVGINDSGGARIRKASSAAGYADIFLRNVLSSGVVPQISAIMGPCAGGAVYSPAMTDFVFMVEKSCYMFITGPEVIRTVTHEEVTMEDLGGAGAHNTKSGVAHFSSPNERESIHTIRELLSFLPSNNMEDPPFRPTEMIRTVAMRSSIH